MKPLPLARQYARAGLVADQNLHEMLTNTLKAVRLEANAVEFTGADQYPRADRSLTGNPKAAAHRRGRSKSVKVSLALHTDLTNTYLLEEARMPQVAGNQTGNTANFTSSGVSALRLTEHSRNQPGSQRISPSPYVTRVSAYSGRCRGCGRLKPRPLCLTAVRLPLQSLGRRQCTW